MSAETVIDVVGATPLVRLLSTLFPITAVKFG